MVHRLVAKAFLANENNLPCVNHINGIKIDNRASNLEWVSFRDNNLHSIYTLGKKHFGQKKVINTETEEVYESIVSASKLVGINYSTLQAKLVGRLKNNTNLKLC